MSEKCVGKMRWEKYVGNFSLKNLLKNALGKMRSDRYFLYYSGTCFALKADFILHIIISSICELAYQAVFVVLLSSRHLHSPPFVQIQ